MKKSMFLSIHVAASGLGLAAMAVCGTALAQAGSPATARGGLAVPAAGQPPTSPLPAATATPDAGASASSAVNPFTGRLASQEQALRQLELAKVQTSLAQETYKQGQLSNQIAILPEQLKEELSKLRASSGPSARAGNAPLPPFDASAVRRQGAQAGSPSGPVRAGVMSPPVTGQASSSRPPETAPTGQMPGMPPAGLPVMGMGSGSMSIGGQRVALTGASAAVPMVTYVDAQPVPQPTGTQGPQQRTQSATPQVGAPLLPTPLSGQPPIAPNLPPNAMPQGMMPFVQ
jgi:hypothetical protein